MIPITRRAALAALAATSVPVSSAAVHPDIIKRHDENVHRLLNRQNTDLKSPWCGTYPDDDDLYYPHTAGGILEQFTSAFLHPGSSFHKSPILLERMRLASNFLNASQNEHGNIDLVTTNFNSPPDTAFVVHNVGTAAILARRNQAVEVSALLEPFLRKAGPALTKGGVHTPNHRWVVCYALAQINELFPNRDFVRRVDQWLAEGIDIDADGQFVERSTSVYNPITDRSLVVVAHKLKRPELLEPVRRNLEAMMWLLHPGYEVVTEISRRQDANQRGTMAPYWFPLAYLSRKDSNARFATLAQHFEPTAASLSALMEYPELLEAAPTPEPVPEDYEKHFPALGIARVRRGLTSATLVLGGSERFFSIRRGEAVVAGVRFASAFFGKGQFVPAKAEKRGSTYFFEQELVADYVQPIGRSITGPEYYTTRNSRQRSEICKHVQSAEVTERKDGFAVRIRAEGTNGVPVAVEINLRDGGKLMGCIHSRVPDAWLLPTGMAQYIVGDDKIRFGPGLVSNRYVQVRGALPKLPGTSAYLTGYTPFNHELIFDWS